MLEKSIAAPPSLLRMWHFRLPPPTQETLRVELKPPINSLRRKKRTGWRRRARDDACRHSRPLSSVFFSWALCDKLSYSGFHEKNRRNNTWYVFLYVASRYTSVERGRTFVFSHQYRIEFNLLNKRESIRFKSAFVNTGPIDMTCKPIHIRTLITALLCHTDIDCCISRYEVSDTRVWR